jgi:hypothetical protein
METKNAAGREGLTRNVAEQAVRWALYTARTPGSIFLACRDNLGAMDRAIEIAMNAETQNDVPRLLNANEDRILGKVA